ncbi:MAG: hypothetical protein FJW95_04620 [Actinobacteria bacterium]|nr:hypothetical protein [Actinomycetota bacterium]
MGADGAGFARWWAARYTRGLPDEVGARRRAEIECDVFEHCQATNGRSAAVAWRTVRGVHADLAWRREERRLMQGSHRTPTRLRTTWSVVTQNWFAPLAVLVAIFDVLLAIGIATEKDGKLPGQAIGPVVLIALAALLVAGLWLRWRAGEARAQRTGSVAAAVPTRWIAGLVAVLVVSLALLVVGVSTGSLVFFFVAVSVLKVVVLVLATVGITRAVRSADPGARVTLANGMIIAGVLPALLFFWMIVPALIALAVIVGVLTTNPRVRPAV